MVNFSLPTLAKILTNLTQEGQIRWCHPRGWNHSYCHFQLGDGPIMWQVSVLFDEVGLEIYRFRNGHDDEQCEKDPCLGRGTWKREWIDSEDEALILLQAAVSAAEEARHDNFVSGFRSDFPVAGKISFSPETILGIWPNQSFYSGGWITFGQQSYSIGIEARVMGLPQSAAEETVSEDGLLSPDLVHTLWGDSPPPLVQLEWRGPTWGLPTSTVPSSMSLPCWVRPDRVQQTQAVEGPEPLTELTMKWGDYPIIVIVSGSREEVDERLKSGNGIPPWNRPSAAKAIIESGNILIGLIPSLEEVLKTRRVSGFVPLDPQGRINNFIPPMVPSLRLADGSTLSANYTFSIPRIFWQRGDLLVAWGTDYSYYKELLETPDPGKDAILRFAAEIPEASPDVDPPKMLWELLGETVGDLLPHDLISILSLPKEVPPISGGNGMYVGWVSGETIPISTYPVRLLSLIGRVEVYANPQEALLVVPFRCNLEGNSLAYGHGLDMWGNVFHRFRLGIGGEETP